MLPQVKKHSRTKCTVRENYGLSWMDIQWFTGRLLSPAVYGMLCWNRDEPERSVFKEFRNMYKEIKVVYV